MKLIETKLKDVYLIEPRIFHDERGYFYESYNQNNFIANGLEYNFVQDNESKSSYGVVRGLHYQLAPYAQSKLVRALVGKIYDVVVDLREKSPTYGQWEGFELSSENKLQLLIPRGFAHGFSVLSDEAIFAYKCDNFYHKESERGISYNDKNLDIDWKIPIEKAIVSAKDKVNPDFAEAEKNFIYQP